MGWTCRLDEGDEKCNQSFDGETWKTASWNPRRLRRRWEDISKSLREKVCDGG
jgi:hypothetical protein